MTFCRSGFCSETYKFDQTGSAIGFRVHQFLGTTHGKFKQFEGRIDLDREHPDRSSVSVNIQVNSIDTGIAKRDEHLRGAEFFNSAKYPEIKFRSRTVRQTGNQSADITGDLTMHGVTRTITLHVKLMTPMKQQTSAAQTRWEITTDPIIRRDFGLLWPQAVESVSMISEKVVPDIRIEAVRAQ